MCAQHQKIQSKVKWKVQTRIQKCADVWTSSRYGFAYRIVEQQYYREQISI